MTMRSCVIRAVPAAAINRAPAMAAISRATARDTRTWAPRKLIFTASAFWIMKITSTIRARTLTIKAVRALLIEVRSRRRLVPRPWRAGRSAAGPSR